MASDIPFALRTAYADLLERCATDAFQRAFPEDGAFTPKTLRGRVYWYFQTTDKSGLRVQRYVGPETPDLLDRIRRHREGHADKRDRRAVVAAILRNAPHQRPIAEIGRIVEVLAGSGAFRRRAVLVGTVAYQTYSAMLGVRLAGSAIQTGDIDVAQFRNISVAIEESAPAMLDILRKADVSFRPVPHLRTRGGTTTYVAKGGIRVDFLAPNSGPETDEPMSLPALGTEAQPLRFLDFLIHEPVPALVLHGEGVYVQVPAPERFAVQKLIVSRLRGGGSAKTSKDIDQAAALFGVLAVKRPQELRDAWQEAFKRGKKWRRFLGEGLGFVDPAIRDRALLAVGAPRSVIPGLDLAFSAPRARYDAERDIVEFIGTANGAPVRCGISREALEDFCGVESFSDEQRVKAFRDNRSMIEKMAREKFLSWPVDTISSVLITAADVQKSRHKPRKIKRK